MDLISIVRAGGSGLVLTILFVTLNSYLFFLDNKLLKNDGIVGISLTNVAGVSTSTPTIIGAMYPAILGAYVSGATS